MSAIVEFSTVVKEAFEQFSRLFAKETECIHFTDYLTDFMVTYLKYIAAINRKFAATIDQPFLNRWVIEANWDVERLNQERLAWLQKVISTRYCAQGVIPIDNILVDHSGKFIEDVGYFCDRAELRYKIAHDYIIGNYVCTSGKYYPLEFHRFIKKQQCQEKRIAFRDYNILCHKLVDWVTAHKIPGDFTFDCWFTHVVDKPATCIWSSWQTAFLRANCGKAVLRQTLSPKISWAVERIEVEGWNYQQIKLQLDLP